MATYSQKAKEARLKVLELVFKAQSSHIGSNFSVIDILTVLFDKVDPEKDEVILSAGWKASAWYFFLWKKGVITEEELNSYCQPDSPFIGLVEPMNRWGLRFAGGSMGYGLPFGVGVALSKKMKGEAGKVYVVMSDGEIAGGTTHESFLIARNHNLDNLVVIIDGNSFQAMGKTNDILKTRDWKPAGCLNWSEPMSNSNGHDFEDVKMAIEHTATKQTQPGFIYFCTTKGKGVSFMENNNLYHYKNLSKEEYEEAKKEINDR